MTTLLPATPADVPAAVALRDEAARWMLARGIRQWRPGDRPASYFTAAAAAGELLVWRSGDAVLSAVVVSATDRTWPSTPPGTRYLHSLVTDRAHAGLGRRILAATEARLRAAGIVRVRLDCVAGNARLRAYYRDAGYTDLGARDLAPPWGLGRPLREAAAPTGTLTGPPRAPQRPAADSAARRSSPHPRPDLAAFSLSLCCDMIAQVFERRCGMETLRRAVRELADRPVDPAPGLDQDVVELRRLIDALEGVWTRWIGALDGSGSLDAEAGTGSWLRAACHLGPGAARSRVVLARRLAERPVVAAAAVEGALSVDHARLVTTALAELADAAGPAVAAGAEAPLVEAARRCDPGRLRREIAHARHALTPEAAVDDAERLHQRRRFDVATTFDGAVHVEGLLDPEAGDLLLTALAPLSGRHGPDDDRTPGQRRADALTDLCRTALTGGLLPELAGERPHLTVVVPAATLAGRPGTRAADTGWGAVLTGETTRRIACDASVTRVVTAADPSTAAAAQVAARVAAAESQPLDVGRRTRVVPPAIRTALAVRDGGCVHPDCDRPPQWTDAHHVTHWADGGPTSLDNLVLLCRRHHRAVHEGRHRLGRAPAGGWQLVRGPAPPLAA